MSEPETPAKLDAASLGAIVDDPLVLEGRDDLAAIVPVIPAASFVRIARRLRDEQRLDLLLAHATADQLTSLLDLDGWTRDRIDIVRLRRWLAAIGDANAMADRPRGSLAELVTAMDPELWTLALHAGTRIAVLDDDDDEGREQAHAAMAELRTWQTPDGFFLIGVPDDELGHQVLTVLARVYDDDLSLGRRLVLSIEAALPAEIEEQLLRFRSGRLADLGFVEWDDAVKLFRPVDHRAAADAAARDFRWLGGEDDPVASLRLPRGSELLRRALARLSDAEHGVRAREFLLLVNEVIAAQRLPPGDEAAQERAIDQTQATLGLGLEMLLLARPGLPEPDAFLADRIAAIGLREVFRVGYGALDRLRRAALSLHRGVRVSLASVGSLLDRPWGPAIAAFVRLYPELPLESTATGTRPIRSLADIARATERIAEAGALAALTYAPAGYAIDPAWVGRLDEPERIVLGDLLRTAIVVAQLPGTRASFVPLTADDLAWAQEHLLVGGQLRDDVHRDVSARCDALGIGKYTGVLSDNLLTRLRIELLGLEREDGKIDLTRVAGLVTIQSVGMWLTVGAGAAASPD